MSQMSLSSYFIHSVPAPGPLLVNCLCFLSICTYGASEKTLVHSQQHLHQSHHRFHPFLDDSPFAQHSLLAFFDLIQTTHTHLVVSLLACLGPHLRVSEFRYTVQYQPTEKLTYKQPMAVNSPPRLSHISLDLSAASAYCRCTCTTCAPLTTWAHITCVTLSPTRRLSWTKAPMELLSQTRSRLLDDQQQDLDQKDQGITRAPSRSHHLPQRTSW